MNGITSFFGRLGPTRVFAILGVTALIGAGLFALMFRLGGEEKALLFSDVSIREAGEITQRLDQAGVEYDLSPDGGAIFVPRSRVLDARMMLSADGLPSRGSVGYEIFDKPEALGQTSFQQNINRLRALEGELARTIASLDGVESARVHLVLPERQLFERDRQEPSASIVIQLRRDDLTSGQVRAIRNLVASAVPGLQANRVTILDERGDLLAAAASEDGASGVAADGVDARQAAAEQRIRATVLDIVEGVVGPGRARVQVTAEMDFNRVTETAERFDPEGRVVRSTSTTESTTSNAEGGAQAASASANIPDGAGGAGGAGGQAQSESAQETVNYEISRTTRTSVSEGGEIKRLSVAVAVDGTTAPAGENGEPGAYTPRTEEELQRITALVRAGVGFNQERGDTVEVVNLPFAGRAGAPAGEAEAGGLFDLSALSPMRLAEVGAMLIAALALIFFVLRPLIAGLVRGNRAAGPDLGAAALTGPDGASAPALLGPGGAPGTPGGDTAADMARIEGAMRASTTRRVAEVVEQHPEESAQLIRTWLSNAN
ncbi:MAG: flagellar M-ring protein FliF [Alphaproteobacteria bacterium]|nr:flagellar M-ring protein FliF [Alphaproteobacteria bacterium]